MSDDLVTRLRESSGMTTSRSDDGFMSIHPDTDLMRQAADEIERLRRERNKWFLVARQLRDALLSGNGEDANNAIDNYLRTRGNLEDPREAVTDE